MGFKSINPADGTVLKAFEAWNAAQLEDALDGVAMTTPGWAATALAERCRLMGTAAQVLRNNLEKLARMITLEMGKLIKEARGEIEKCAWACEYYAEHGPRFIADEFIETDATRSLVAYQPLGTVLAVMPWNFPFWQVFRFAAPALVGGNTGVLKHAANVPQCALAIEQVFREAGFPPGVFRTLLIRSDQVQGVIEDPRVHAVTITGSEGAGRKVAAAAGSSLKKSVLELGGSDAFIVLEDADLDEAVKHAVMSRFLNTGQSCIAAKRFIVVEAAADAFLTRFKQAVEALHTGDPMEEATTLAPMARHDLRDELHHQVAASIGEGAVPVTGCEPVPGPGAFYRPSILDGVKAGMTAYQEEMFGPVAAMLRAKDEHDAVRLANDNRYGLGASVWTRDAARGEAVARQLQAGACFVNGIVKSDPRLPFGGVKASGYGRELSHHGIREFLNAKTVWVK
jgi:succinate-semialdehyde dehydrogenase/glutarate-semialdehyde dehydrogenase